ncbi:MAG: acetylesterase [Solobacterium sp.]|nr:acetylesterase [Solobacterium sp.]
MAVFSVMYRSDVLKRDIPFKAYLPVDYPVEYHSVKTEKYRTLYFLHGLNYNCEAWLKETRIDRLARDLNLAVIFPDGENSFYVEGLGPNSDYGALISEELVTFTRTVFPLSQKREDTFIGGFSMGGFGALRNGLNYADTFSKILAFSSAIHMFEFEPGDPNRAITCNEDLVFGSYEQAKSTTKNPAVCLKELSNAVEEGTAVYPEIYMICGKQDGLLAANRSFRDKLLEAGAPLRYEEYEGIHSHDFVSEHLNGGLAWLMDKE